MVEATITGKYTLRHKNAGHESKCGELIREEMDRVEEESGISIRSKIREIGCFSLDEIDFHPHPFWPYFHYAYLRSAQLLRLRIDANYKCQAPLAFDILCYQ